MSDADVKLDIGRDLTRGLGAGADPDKGRQAAEDHADEIEEVLKGADMVFVTAGEGGGTGTGGAPIVARIARSAPSRSASSPVRSASRAVAGPTRPRRSRRARRGRHPDRHPNDKLLEMTDHQVAILDAFRQADQVLMQGGPDHGPHHDPGAHQPRLRRREGGRRTPARPHGIGSACGIIARAAAEMAVCRRCSRRASRAPTACCCRSPGLRPGPRGIRGGEPHRGRRSRRGQHLRHGHRRRARRRGPGVTVIAAGFTAVFAASRPHAARPPAGCTHPVPSTPVPAAPEPVVAEPVRVAPTS